MQAQITKDEPNSIRLTLDAEAARVIAASLRFAGRYHKTFQELSDRIAGRIEVATVNSSRN